MLRGALIDLSGTLHIDNAVTPNAVAALEKLRQHGIKSTHQLHHRLASLGFRVKPEELFTSLSAAKQLVHSQRLNPLLFLTDSAKAEFNADRSLPLSSPTQRPYDAVVVGLSPQDFHYDKLNEAFGLLRQGAPLIAIHKARYFARPDGLALGPGGFVEALEYASGTKAQVVGKPQAEFFRLALHRLGLAGAPHAVAMVGDDVEQDLGDGAASLGLRRYLVKTGKYMPGDESRATVPLAGVHDCFADAVEAIVSCTPAPETKALGK
ncbi:hypothetical protein H4R34_001614 [Dimargaris verticillata]|uniref:Haloacid dehalogenase-like hydrolase domain-containing protein 2 n=1 Tax=Dimargaris verticillata TaxID=2761393 RepID=A0A9W8EEB9_9FUNG|nr:hypothetical protein H4R34_001614 [Dimargaris verticillata]